MCIHDNFPACRYCCFEIYTPLGQVLRPILQIQPSVMIDLTQWRARIGSWCSCRIPSKHATGAPISTKMTESLGVVESGDENCRKILLVVFLVLLLILSGDIELNPGPKTGEYCHTY